VTHPHELVLVTVRGTQYGSAWGDGNELSYPMYEDLRGHNDVFTGMFVSGTYFPTLGVTAARGRVIEPGDDTAASPEPVVVLSHAYWTSRFAADPAFTRIRAGASRNHNTRHGTRRPRDESAGGETAVDRPTRWACY
jgi:hypothetical protein